MKNPYCFNSRTYQIRLFIPNHQPKRGIENDVRMFKRFLSPELVNADFFIILSSELTSEIQLTNSKLIYQVANKEAHLLGFNS